MEKMIERIRNSAASLVKWEVSEKLHGANFSFIVTKDDIQIASRNGIIEGNFYNSSEAVRVNLDKARLLFEKQDNIEVLTIYGELYGDGVQKGVKYYDDQRFAAFDMAIDGEYLDPEVFIAYADLVQLPRVHSFGIFSFEDALKVSNTFITHHSDDQSEDNICEGVVLKPVDASLTFSEDSRMVLKNKNSIFSEKSTVPKAKIVVELTTEDQTLLTEIESLVNINRINAVLSKEASISIRMFGKYLGLTRKDVLDELGGVKLTKLMQKEVDKLIIPVLRPRLLELEQNI